MMFLVSGEADNDEDDEINDDDDDDLNDTALASGVGKVRMPNASVVIQSENKSWIASNRVGCWNRKIFIFSVYR